MRRSLMIRLAIALGAVAAAVPASASRTVVDFNFMTGEVLFARIGGYCDLDGADCTPTKLPFLIDFGNGATDSIILYGNGLLSFGDQPIDLATLVSYTGSLSSFGATVISPEINNATVEDFAAGGSGLQVFAQNAELSIASDRSVQALWLWTAGTTSSSLLYRALLQPQSNGLLVTFSYNRTLDNFLNTPPPIANSGYAIAGQSVEQSTLTGRSFLIPATITIAPSVPEPATWAMLIGGFGLAGFGLRRQRALRVATIAPQIS